MPSRSSVSASTIDAASVVPALVGEFKDKVTSVRNDAILALEPYLVRTVKNRDNSATEECRAAATALLDVIKSDSDNSVPQRRPHSPWHRSITSWPLVASSPTVRGPMIRSIPKPWPGLLTSFWSAIQRTGWPCSFPTRAWDRSVRRHRGATGRAR